ncbi:hypothetical protein BX600DRAFT_529081 [Xylariales sp. PMI_506]|nr:hypothetical protein BX600DRAFT_529081 [Xylariales sp. PMI_506]
MFFQKTSSPKKDNFLIRPTTMSCLPRACDRCHAIKERCCWASGSAQCDRCKRLRHECKNIRPARRAGRKPGGAMSACTIPTQTDLQSMSSDEESAMSDSVEGLPSAEDTEKSQAFLVSPQITALVSIWPGSNLSAIERDLLMRMLMCNESCERFLIGPSFCQGYREHILSRVIDSRETLNDAIIASAIPWAHDSGEQLSPTKLAQCYRRASLAIADLRAFQVRDEEDATQCLILGGFITTFALNLRVGDTATICSQTLGLVKSILGPQPRVNLEKMKFLTCLTLMELNDSLFRCRIPTLRWQPAADEPYVDPYIGLCISLLPFLQDICELSNALLHADLDDFVDIHLALNSVELSITRWQPLPPHDFPYRFTPTEAAHMVCQAQVLRTAYLLIIHRLRYPFGSHVEVARTMALSILTQLDMVLLTTKSSVRCVELAFIVACIELEEADERDYWLHKIDVLVGYSPAFKKHLEDFVTCMWAAREISSTIYWYNVGDHVPSFL